MFDYSGYREVERDNQGYETCDRFSELHLRLNLTLFKQPLSGSIFFTERLHLHDSLIFFYKYPLILFLSTPA